MANPNQPNQNQNEKQNVNTPVRPAAGRDMNKTTDSDSSPKKPNQTQTADQNKSGELAE